MKHIETHRWLDHARGLLDDEERAAADAHAATCATCRRTGEVMGRLATVARADAAYDVPSDAVERALEVFAVSPSKRREKLTQAVARLVYDSFRAPLPAGVRAANRVDQVLYEADEFTLDLQVHREHVERKAGLVRVVLVGQIADRNTPARRLSGRPVLLLSGRKVTARTLSNELGEFHLEAEPHERLWLQVWVGGDRKIDIPVGRITEADKS